MGHQKNKKLDTQSVTSQLIWEKEKDSWGTDELVAGVPYWEKGGARARVWGV